MASRDSRSRSDAPPAGRVERLLRALGTTVVDRRRRVSTILALFTVASVALFGRFEFESDLATLFPADHDAVALRRLVAGETTASENLLVVLRGEQLDETIPGLVKALEQSPHFDQVVATKEDFLGASADIVRDAPVPFLPTDVLAALEARLRGPDRDRTLDQLADSIAEDPLLGLELARQDPLGVRQILQSYAQEQTPAAFDRASPYLLLRDRKTAFIRLRGVHPAVDMARTHALLADVEQRLEGMDHDLIGGYVIAREMEQQLRFDLIVSMTVAFILISIFLAASTRRRIDPLILMLPCTAVLIWALGWGGLLFGPLTPLATGAAAVLAGLNVDFGIHFLGRYREERAKRGARDALIEAGTHAGRPLGISMATTVVAFSALAWSDFHGLWTFGALLALGVLLSFVSAVTLVPLLLYYVDAKSQKQQPSATNATEDGRATSPVIRAAQGLLQRHAALPVLWITVLVSGAGWGAAALGALSFDADPQRLRRADDPMLAAAHKLEAELEMAPLPVAVLVSTATPLHECAAGLRRLIAENRVKASLGAHRTTPTPDGLARAAQFRDRTAGWLDDTKSALEARGFVASAFSETLHALDSMLQRDPTTVSGEQRTWKGRDYWLLHILPAATPWTATDRRELSEAVRTAIPGDVRVVAALGLSDELTDVLTQDLVRCGLVAAIGVLCIVFLLTGGKVLPLIALTPTLAAIGIVFGYLAWTHSPIHLGNVVVLPFLIGLGIDDGIHMTVRYREELRQGARRRGAIDTVMVSSGTAIWRTSATTFLGFGSLAFAGSPALQSLGILMAIGIATCFVTSLVIVPKLLSWLPLQPADLDDPDSHR